MSVNVSFNIEIPVLNQLCRIVRFDYLLLIRSVHGYDSINNRVLNKYQGIENIIMSHNRCNISRLYRFLLFNAIFV